MQSNKESGALAAWLAKAGGYTKNNGIEVTAGDVGGEQNYALASEAIGESGMTFVIL